MFNSGVRGRRAPDNFGTVSSQTQFVQQKSPQPNITGYSIAGTDDTALDPAGGQTILVNGTGFASGAAVTVNGQTISPVTVVSPTQLSFTSIALAGGSYSLIVYNSTGGAAILVPGLIYSAVPTWTTSAGSIGTTYETTPISTSVVATSDSAIIYSLSSGSLPSGATLYANGVITGTSPVESGSTTYTFAIKAEDAELQDTTRTFTLTINTDVVTWGSPADNTTYISNVNVVASNVVLSATSAAGYGITYSANTLPTGLSLSGNTISGTPTVVANSSTLLTATASTTNRSATRTINWVIQLSNDPYFNLTTLLLNGETSSNYWIQDASTNKFALTVNADTRPTAFSPYETVWSNYFDGSGDYLTIAGNAAFLFPGDHTIECWIIWDGTYSAAGRIIYATGGSGSADQVGIFSGSGVYYAGLSSGYTPPTNVWTHIAISRSGSSIRFFGNGTLQYTGTNGSSIGSNSATAYIGLRNDNNHPWLGYISNLRIVKGTALYTSNFTPSTSPLTAVSGTSLLTCQSNRLLDNSTNNFTVTKNGDVTVSNFGPFIETNITTGSGYFDGSGDYLTSSTSFATSNSWTVEAWCYFTGAANNDSLLVGIPERLYILWLGSTLYVGDSQINNIVVSNKPINQWFHIAVVKNSSTYTAYINGTSVGTSGSALISETITSWQIGARVSQSQYATGYISNIRIVNGTAVYTTNFTPPTSPLTAISGTNLLTLQNRLGENNNRFIDTSGMNGIVTRFNNTAQGTFSPFSQTGWSGYFTGTSTSYISTPSTTILNQGQTYTVQCWIYPTVFQTSTSAVRRMYIFVKGVIYAGLSIHSDGTLGWYGWPTPGGMIVTSPAGTITTNVWQHVALVVNPSNYIKLFKNGTEVGSSSYTAAGADGSAILIGNGDTGQSGTDGFIGYISNFKVTLSALTAGQLDYSASPVMSSPSGAALLVLQTNRFNDTSANNLAITVPAAPSIQAFSPFSPAIVTPTSYSGYFDGTTDYITQATNTSYGFGTGNFTIEFWLYLNSTGLQTIYSNLTSASSTNPHIYINSTIRYYTVSGDRITGSSLSSGQWYHIALSRASGSTRLFINGTQSGSTYSDANNYGSTAPLGIGTYWEGGSPVTTNTLFGYMSNLRVVNGTAVYTANFTPPTSPLTAIANTSLLTCQSNRFIDNSTNNFTLTANGDVIATQFNPFGTTSLTLENAAYSVTNVGGSMSFDGSGDYLSLPHSAALVYGTKNFTIEFWIYVNAYGSPSRIFQKGTGPVGYSMDMSSSGTLTYNNNSTLAGSTATINVPLKAWTHVSLVRSGTSTNQTRWYINGQSAGSWTYNVDVSEAESLVIGGSSAAFTVNGYISDFRLINGSAFYSSPFAPPATPLTAITDTTLLLNGTNSGLIDYTSKNNLETLGNAQLRTAITKFGNASMYFDGSGDYLVAAATENFVFSGNFTVEFWMYPTAVASGERGIVGIGTVGASRLVVRLQGGSPEKMSFWLNGPANNIICSTSISANQWYHVALVRSGSGSNNLKLYLNGVLDGQVTSTYSVPKEAMYIGRTYSNLDGEYFTGYIDDLRITNGFSRYTANFTPPTSAFITY